MLVLAASLILYAGLAGSIPTAPVNITVTFISPTSVRVSWKATLDTKHPVESFDITYKPTDARVVAEVTANSEAVELDGLIPDTQYEVTVAAIRSGRKYFSRPIVFRTYPDIEELPRTSPQQDFSAMSINGPSLPTLTDINFNNGHQTIENGNQSVNSTVPELPMIRGVEVGIVLVVLMVWAGAIALFFNRWGKIRMLLPYQPTYKQEQSFKVPGTTACAPGACNGPHSHTQVEEPLTVIAEKTQRSRKNSAIFLSTEGKGFDAIEFSRRYGSQSVLCRNSKSADSIPINDRNRRFSENKIWDIEKQRSLLQRDSIEMVECHNEPSTSNRMFNSKKKAPKLSTLPTLSILVPSPSPSYEEKEEDEEEF